MDTFGVDLVPSLLRLYGHVPDDATLEKLVGDASTRSYYRLRVPRAAAGTPTSAMVMHLPPDALGSDEASGSARPRELPFLDVQRMLATRGLPVPTVLVEDVARRVLVLEDLGDETFLARLRTHERTDWLPLYEQAVDLMVEMHERCAEPVGGSVAYERVFDYELLRWELDHFREWGVEAPWGAMPADVRADLDGRFDALAREIASLPVGFVHRDYQSRNLMWAPRADSTGTLTIIDFQDALQGPRPYDLVALLCDSYVRLDEAMQDALIARYIARRELLGEDARDFERSFWLVAVQRKLKDSGRFVFIDRVRGNPGFLPSYAPSLVNVGRALRRLGGLDGLADLLARLVPGFPDAARTPPVATGSAAPPT